ncbi:hypothetical protein PGTUg99_035009 [Puccinia graminis f. sp. tritici]|uniref:Uncharacterized protein n=1 Tax=Puccinia graminis f. sp. tritici TaxID=56615 RepID=A0A5B0QS65_PUCGR|nr:hypothetical protein PGTUg99_035009 [Puccinia graminis f. sp. tritici]
MMSSHSNPLEIFCPYNRIPRGYPPTLAGIRRRMCVSSEIVSGYPDSMRPSLIYHEVCRVRLEMVEGYPSWIPAIRWRIPASGCGFGCGWPLFRKSLAGIRVSQSIPAL